MSADPERPLSPLSGSLLMGARPGRWRGPAGSTLSSARVARSLATCSACAAMAKVSSSSR